MLKYWVGLLLLLNAAGLAWQWGALATWGWAPPDHHEPERLKQQLRPEAVVPVPVAPAQGVQPAPEAIGSLPAPAPTASHNPSASGEPLPAATPATPATPAAPATAAPAATR